jgi:hypothetical protein
VLQKSFLLLLNFKLSNRHAKEGGLQRRYQGDINFRIFVGQISALAHLPIDEVPDGLEDLRAIAGNDVDKIYMLEYFSEYYVNGKAVAQWFQNQIVIRFREPSYPPPMWNVRTATLEGMDRTNNRCEGNNNRLNGNAGRPGAGGVPKLGVYLCIDFIQVGNNLKFSVLNFKIILHLIFK